MAVFSKTLNNNWKIMQLSVFSTDNNKTGFRLQYMEVYNWGTFDQKIWSVSPLGETSLLTGSNGSGKTTFVDALLTLMVPEKKTRFYNQSSGSEKKGDRTEESYVLGGYSTMQNESGNATRTLFLREQKEEAYSILLANFANEAEQDVTLFQVRYFSGGEMKRVYAIAHVPLHIEEDFKPFDLSGNWRRRLDTRFNKSNRKQLEWFDSAGKYAQRLVTVLGMQSGQALSLFNQTVGIKVLGNLDDFIRTHMLEPRNMEETFLELKQHLATLLEARRNIEKAELQISMLQPLAGHYQRYQEHHAKLKQATEEAELLRIWERYTRSHLLDEALEAVNRETASIREQLKDAGVRADKLREEERSTHNLIDQNKAGQRLKELEQEQKQLQDKLEHAEQALYSFMQLCKTAGILDQDTLEEATYNHIRKEADRLSKRLSTEMRNNDEERYEARDNIRDAEAAKKAIEQELGAMVSSKHNIPVHLVNLRRELCQTLKIDMQDLPFAGELMQVKDEELDWQPALEKLLHSFSLRLLVPEHYYKKVNKYVNNTNLRSRLVYNRVADEALDLYPDEGTVYEKLDFHPEHPLADWVGQQVIRQYGFSCVDTDRELARYDRAITINGLIKNKNHHEKDDRPGSNDPGRYVMGWNNEQKKEALQQQRGQLLHEIETATEAFERAERRSKRLQAQQHAIAGILGHKGYQEINLSLLHKDIKKTEDQQRSLQQSSDQLKELVAQLEQIRAAIKEQETLRDTLLRSQGSLDGKFRQLKELRDVLAVLVSELREDDKDRLLQFQQRHNAKLGEISLERLDQVYQELQHELQEQKKQLEDICLKEERQLDRAIIQIKNPAPEVLQQFTDWAADVHELPGEKEFIQEYIDWLEKLETENLPKYKQDFERYLHDTMVYKIGELNEVLESWERRIRTSIDNLNKSLGGINFNRLPDTYIQLGLRPVADTTIKEFRARLLNALPQAANWQQSSFEDKATHFREHIQPLIDSLDRQESYRARVLDVRNWFEFWADEKYRSDNEVKKTYRQMGQLSGGEKAQLTYTILCSAIAYQFGLTKGAQSSRSLRFIAVDESFSNQDEEKATYLMELCRQLHLQLLVVTPSDKIQIVEDYIAHIHLVQRVDHRHSVLYNMTIKEFKEERKSRNKKEIAEGQEV